MAKLPSPEKSPKPNIVVDLGVDAVRAEDFELFKFLHLFFCGLVIEVSAVLSRPLPSRWRGHVFENL